MTLDFNSQPLKTPNGEPMRELIASELGLRPRLFAAAVFAIAAMFPVMWFFYLIDLSDAFQASGKASSESLSLVKPWLFGILPVSAAALCGFTVGSHLADTSEKTTDFRAAGRGIAVALLSYVLFMICWLGTALANNLLTGQYSNQAFEAFVGWFVVIFVFGLVVVGWLLAGAGAFAGLLLKYISTSSRFIHRWNTVRVPAGQATGWKMVAGLLFLSAYLIYLFNAILNLRGAVPK